MLARSFGRHALLCVTAAASLVATSADASEGAGDTHPNGVEDWSVGRLPPPGIYGLVYTNYYSADRFKDQPVKFRVDAESVTPRILWVTPVRWLGAAVATQALVPLVRSHVRLNGVESRETGAGDVTVSPALLDWSVSDRLDVIAGLDVVVPTGDYDARRGANPGRHHWVVRPAAAATWTPGRWEFSAELGYDVNFRNSATGERSGRTAHVDFVVGLHPSARWSAGLGGYWLRQLTDDHLPGGVIPHGGFPGAAWAVGPTVRVGFGGLALIAKVHREFAVQNRPEGTSAWLIVVMAWPTSIRPST